MKKKRAEKALMIFLMMIWVFASVIASQFIIGYLMLWILGAERFNEAVWTAIYSAVAYSLAMFLVIFVPGKVLKTKKAKTDRTELGLRGLPTWTDIGLAPAGFFIYLILAAGLVALFSIFPWFNAEQTQELGFSVLSIGFDRIVAFVTLVVVAPIVEEVIFRGWLYGKMRAELGMAVSIFLVSLLFGIVHLQWNVGVNVFAMSIVLCGLREVTGTIYAGILLHMLKNGVAFYLLYVLGI